MDDWYRDDVQRSRGLSEYEYEDEDYYDEDTGLEEGELVPDHWSQKYIEDHCEACPECCVNELWDAGEGEEE